MKNLALPILKSILTVFVFVLLFSACTSNQSLTRNDDFYNRRIVNKKENKDYAMHLFHRHSSKATLQKNIQSENKESVLAAKGVTSLADLADASNALPQPSVDIASVDNKLFVDLVHQKLSKKFNNLYQTNTDLRSFRKGYKEIKKEQISKFISTVKTDDPKGQKAPGGGKPGMSIASFVLGLVGLLVAGLICGTLAVVFGVIGMKKGMKGLAIAGIILGIIDIIGAIIVLSA